MLRPFATLRAPFCSPMHLLRTTICSVCQLKKTIHRKTNYSTHSYLLAGKARGQGLRQLLRLLRVLNIKRVQVPAAADLELGAVLPLGNLHGFGVLATRLLKEIANIGNLLGPVRVTKEEKRHVSKVPKSA